MRKNGFTLIELLAIIIILGVIAIITTPLVINVVIGAETKARESSIYGYADGLKLAIYDYMYKEDTFGQKPIVNKDWADSQVELSTDGVVCEEVFYKESYGAVLNNCTVSSDLQFYCLAKGNLYDCNDSEFKNILGEVGGSSYQDGSGANYPQLLDKMIPIKWSGTNWVYADLRQEWYNYNNKEWANAVILNDGIDKKVGDIIAENDIALWYVWIPRYKYVLFNSNNGVVEPKEIEVIFESDLESSSTANCKTDTSGTESSEICTDTNNGVIKDNVSTYTHPAFTFGAQELTGIWVGKFEASTTDNNCLTEANATNCNKVLPITTKPNVVSLRNIAVSNLFNSIHNISDKYKLDSVDSHMIKNMEWGAIAYFKQSKYGLGVTDIGTNNNNSFLTGCGVKPNSGMGTTCNSYDTQLGMLASTTGNIHGIYDMSGGAEEYVMANMVDETNNFYSRYSGFSTAPNSKYYDAYSYGTSNITHSRGKLGDATRETLAKPDSTSSGWSGDSTYFLNTTSPWFFRGGSPYNGQGSGVFRYNTNYGNTNSSYSSRIVLVSG